VRPIQRVLGFLVLAVLAACSLPIPSRAATVTLKWTATVVVDPVTGTNRPDKFHLYEQAATGTVTLPGLAGKWRELATPDMALSDEDATKPGHQQSFPFANVTSGPHTYVVTAENIARTSGPSNTKLVDVPIPVIAPQAVILEATVTVP
jgi:hypothetical protein